MAKKCSPWIKRFLIEKTLFASTGEVYYSTVTRITRIVTRITRIVNLVTFSQWDRFLFNSARYDILVTQLSPPEVK